MSETDKSRKVTEIKGIIETADGTKTEFSIFKDFGWTQWGGNTPELGTRVDVLEAMVAGLKDANIDIESDYDEDDEDEQEPDEAEDPDEDEATYKIVRFYGPGDERPNEVQDTGLTLEQAKAHCALEASKGPGWFDGFVQEA